LTSDGGFGKLGQMRFRAVLGAGKMASQCGAAWLIWGWLMGKSRETGQVPCLKCRKAKKPHDWRGNRVWTMLDRPAIGMTTMGWNRVKASDKQSMQRDLGLAEPQPARTPHAGGILLARAIALLCVVLFVGGPAYGQFMIQPMRVDLGTYPNRQTVTAFAIENQSANSAYTIDLRLLDMTQDSSGVWQTIEPDAEVIADPNGARWVDIGTDDRPERVDISGLRSCLSWLRLDNDVVDLSPLQRKVMNLWIRVPSGVLGHHCAALIARTKVTAAEDTGITSPVLIEFLIPVIINVQGRTMRDEIGLVDADMRFREAAGIDPAATLVTLAVNNKGGTYARIVGVTRVYREVGGHWQRVKEMHSPDLGIIPGVKINLQQDIGQPLPSGKYRVEGALYVNTRRADTITKEINFAGDDRIIAVPTDGALNLDPREVPIEVIPGATRTTILKVANTSEDPVIVDAALSLPDHMAVRAFVDEQGNSIRGQDFGCVEWVTIEPTQFTLRGYGRMNLKVISRMPALEAPLPNYYATVTLHATYESGLAAGTTQGLIYLNTRNVKGNPRIKGDQLTVSESAPSRYIVTASFSNIGDTHVLPRCRVLLTEVGTGPQGLGLTLRDLEMSSATYDQRGNMLPLEVRQFTAVLDVASVPTGTYYLTAALQYGPGASAQRQTAIRIREEGGAKSVEVISLDTVGGPTQIQL
jgi:hypothetical protein